MNGLRDLPAKRNGGSQSYPCWKINNKLDGMIIKKSVSMFKI